MERDPSEMSPAELRCLREALGLTVRAMSAAVGQTYQTITRWESGERRLSAKSAAAIRDLVERTDRAVEDLVAAHAPGERIITYPTDQAYRASNPGIVLSAAWHRQVARRAAEVCGARIDYGA